MDTICNFTKKTPFLYRYFGVLGLPTYNYFKSVIGTENKMPAVFFFYLYNITFTLVLMGCFKLLVLMGGGVNLSPPPFLFMKSIEKVIRL